MAARASCARPRSSAWRAMPASRRSAAVLRKSCWRRSPSGSGRPCQTDRCQACWPAMTEPRYWDDYQVGQKFPLGSTTFTEQEIVDFARQFDPQSFHVEAEAAKASMFGGIIASGWHIASKMMRLFVDNYVDHRTALGSPGVDELRW